DLVFANSRNRDQWLTESYVYFGKPLGGFDYNASKIETTGAHDVKVDDLDGDGDEDIVFACFINDSGELTQPSNVFMNDGSGRFPYNPSHYLYTRGAMSVEVTDLDGTGWKDLVFAQHTNGTSFLTWSDIEFGMETGWYDMFSRSVRTAGASDVAVEYLFDPGDAGYMSQAITPIDPDSTGGFHTLRYTANIGVDVNATVHVFDAITWEVLASTRMASGTNEWDLRGEVYFKSHQSIRLVVELQGLEDPTDFTLDELYVNWTGRVKAPPVLEGMDLSDRLALRMTTVTLRVWSRDEYDPPEDMFLTIEHQLSGETMWKRDMVRSMKCVEGVWNVELYLGPTLPVGNYRFKASLMDQDGMETEMVSLRSLDVLNHVPTAPGIALEPERPTTGDTLRVTITRSARDEEGQGLSYRFYWYRMGTLVPELTSDSVGPEHTFKGQNWSVKVKAFDGDDEGPAATAWVVIGNSPVTTVGPIMEIIIPEDGSYDELFLTEVFNDPDGGLLSFSYDTDMIRLEVSIDEVTGQVTLTPEENWWGEGTITFRASDGDSGAELTVSVSVSSVNDLPFFETVNDEPVTGDTYELTVRHGEELLVSFTVHDIDGDETTVIVDSDDVDLGSEELGYIPPTDFVGLFTFNLSLHDDVQPGIRVKLTFLVTVENVNDPPDPPRITSPLTRKTFKVNETFRLRGECFDLDQIFGQVLTYAWSSNISGHLGDGSNITVAIAEAGTHLVTLTVSDGEFERTASIELVIEPLGQEPEPPGPSNGGNGGGGDGGVPMGLIMAILAVVIIVVLAAVLLAMRGRGVEPSMAEEAPAERESSGPEGEGPA
ncbi:MAG: VCBS repeat-containing protein, partial [Thermoplasmata archaeon]